MTSPAEIVPRPNSEPMIITNDDLSELLGWDVDEMDAPEVSFGPFRGKGSQALAMAAGAFVVQDLSAYEMYAFATVDARDAFAEARAAEGHEVVERCRGDQPCRAFIDVDAPVTATDAQLAMITDAFGRAAAEIGAPTTVPLEVGVDRCDKRSRHLLSDRWRVANGVLVRMFAERVKAILVEDGEHTVAGWVDVIGGISTYGLRLPFTLKRGVEGTTLVGDGVIGDWFLQGGDEQVVTADVLAVPVARKFDEPTPSTAARWPEFANLIAKKFADRFGEPDTAPVENRPDLVARYDRIGTSICDACSRIHHKAGAFVTVASDGSLFLRCRRAATNAKSIAWMAGPDPAPAPADAFDQLEGDDVEMVHGKYNGEVIDAGGGEDLYIGSSWGTGKSHQTAGIIRDLRARDPEAVVIAISSRKSLSAQQVADIDAVSYTRIKGVLDTTKYPVSIWQIESLKRVPCDLPRIDLLIVDELSQLNAHAFALDNGSASAGMTSVKMLARIAKRVIVTDNDLASRQVDYFRRERQGRRARTIRNTATPWAHIVAKTYRGRPSVATVEKKLFEYLDAAFEDKKAGRVFKAASVACHSRKHAEGIAAAARARYGDELVKYYESGTSDHVKAHDFADATAAWADAIVVVYTGTVSVGISCQDERFEHCFAFFNDKNAGSKQSAQMVFRCRQLKAVTVSAVMSRALGSPTTPEAVCAWATLAKNRASIPDGLRHDRCPMIDTMTASDPAALLAVTDTFEGGMWMSAMLDRHRSNFDFITQLTRVLGRAGIANEVIDVTEAPTIPDEVAHADAAAKAHAAHARADLMSESILAARDAVEDGAGDEDGKAKSASEKAGARALYMANTFSIPAEAVAEAGGDWIERYEMSTQPYARLSAHLRGAERAGNTLLMTASEREAGALARLAFEAVGLSPDIPDGDVDVRDVEALVATPNQTIQLINANSLRLYDDRHGARRAKAKTMKPRSAVATLNAALRYFGAELVPAYDTERQKARRTPARYSLTWLWGAGAELGPPCEPRPQHPGT